MANKTQASFIAALTAVNQIGIAERTRLDDRLRRDKRRALKIDRYKAWMLARSAFHAAMATKIAACAARVLGQRDADQLSMAEASAVAQFIEAADRFMLLPLLGKDDYKERKVLLRQWADCATTVDTAPAYQSRSAAWEAHLADSFAREGR